MRYFFAILVFAFVSAAAHSQTVILNEDFQTGFPFAWKKVINDTCTVHPDVSEFDAGWIIKENPDTLVDSVMACTSYFEFGGTASRWVITDQLQLGAYGNYLKWDAKSHDPSFPDGYVVLISKTNDSLHNFTDTLFYTDFELPDWETRDYNLVDSTYSNAQIYIAFVAISNDQYILYIDNIRVTKESPLSIQEFKPFATSTVYPNPFNSHISISTEEEITKLELYDLSGKKLIKKEQEVYQLNDLNALNPGIYFLHICYKNNLKEVKKLIKE